MSIVSIPDRSYLVWHVVCDSVNMFIPQVNNNGPDAVRYQSIRRVVFLGDDALLGELNFLVVKLEAGFRLNSE